MKTFSQFNLAVSECIQVNELEYGWQRPYDECDDDGGGGGGFSNDVSIELRQLPLTVHLGIVYYFPFSYGTALSIFIASRRN